MIELVAVLGGVGLGVAYLAVRGAIQRRALATRWATVGPGEPCPSCAAPEVAAIDAVLETARDERGKWQPRHVTRYECRGCAAQFARLNRGPLIPKHAWDAGARDAFPMATVRELK